MLNSYAPDLALPVSSKSFCFIKATFARSASAGPFSSSDHAYSFPCFRPSSTVRRGFGPPHASSTGCLFRGGDLSSRRLGEGDLRYSRLGLRRLRGLRRGLLTFRLAMSGLLLRLRGISRSSLRRRSTGESLRRSTRSCRSTGLRREETDRLNEREKLRDLLLHFLDLESFSRFLEDSSSTPLRIPVLSTGAELFSLEASFSASSLLAKHHL